MHRQYPVGAATSQVASLTVRVPPLIVVSPTDQTVVAGTDAILHVAAVGATPLYYQWQFNGTNLPGATNASLLLASVQMADAGDYRVAVSNDLGSVLSETATLTVINADSDGDGLPNAWESANGLDGNDPRDALMDTDRDGLNNYQEYLAGTSPTNRLSYLKIDRIEQESQPSRVVRLTFLAMSNKTYTVLGRDSLESNLWTRVADILATPTNRVVEVPHLPPADVPRWFYRLITPQLSP